MIFALDKYEAVRSVLSNQSPDSCPYIDDSINERLNDGLLTFEFKAPANRPEVSPLVVENYVLTKSLEGGFLIFKIKEVNDVYENGEHFKSVYAENSALSDLYGHIIRPISLTGVTAKQALTSVLDGTDWKVGEVHGLEIQTFDFTDHSTAVKALHDIRATFSGEIRFRVEFEGRKIVARYIDLLSRRGSETGQRFEYARDIKGLTRTEDSTELVTALIGLGKANEDEVKLDFKAVNFPDSPSGIDFVFDKDALARYGKNGRHIMGVFEDSNETSLTALYRRTKEELKKRSKPRLTYTIDLLLLERLTGYEAKKVRLGDTILVKDMSFTPYLLVEARVIELTRSATDPRKDVAILGEFVPMFIDTIEVVSNLQAKVNRSSTKWEQGGETIFKSKTPPTELKDGLLWLDLTPYPNVLKRWDASSGSWVRSTPTQASEVGAETPTGAQNKANKAKDDAVSIADQDATEKAGQAENNAKGHANTVAGQAEENAKSHADTVAGQAEENAKTYADTIATQVEADANAHADQKASDAEEKAKLFTESYSEKALHIDATAPTDTTVLWMDTSVNPYILKKHNGTSWVNASPTRADQIGAETPSGAQAKANTAKSEAISTASTDATNKATTAESNAKAYAETVASQAEKDAKAHADSIASQVEKDAKAHADAVAGSAEDNAKLYTESYSEKAIHIASTAPTDTTKLWLDTSVIPNILKRYSGTVWVKSSPTSASEVGAETPSGAQAKANTAKSDAISQASTDATNKANQAKSDAISTASTDATNKADKALSDAKAHANTVAGTAESNAKAYAESVASTAESNAKAHAESKASTAQANAKLYTESYSEKAMHVGTVAPTDKEKLWLDTTNASLTVLKRWNGTAWVKATPTSASEIGAETPSGASTKAGTAEANAKNFAKNASNITIGTLDATKVAVANLSASVIQTGVLDASLVTVNNLDASKITTGTLSADRIYGGTINGSNVIVTNLSAGAITSGTIDASKIGVTNLSATNIKSGTLDAGVITVANLSASVLQTGVLDASKVTVNNLSAGRITSGTMSADRIYGGTISGNTVTVTNINASNITAGTLSASRLSANSITSDKINVTTLSSLSANLGSITAGTIDASRVTIANLSASIIQAGVLDASKITVNNLSANSITGGTLSADRIYGGVLSGDNVIIKNLKAGYITSGTLNADQVTISSASSGVTINSSGITVENGSFLIQDENTNGATITKYSLDAVNNLCYDHSFEMLEALGLGGGLSYYRHVVGVTDPIYQWGTQGSPLVYTVLNSDMALPEFGNQAVAVNNSNYVYQDISVEPYASYIVSFHVKAPKENISGYGHGIPRLDVQFYADSQALTDGRVTQTFPQSSDNIYERSRRYFVKVDAPNALSNVTQDVRKMRIRVLSANSGYVEVDGVQVIFAGNNTTAKRREFPTAYDPEQGVWDVRRGGQKQPVINAIGDRIRIGKLELPNGHMLTSLNSGYAHLRTADDSAYSSLAVNTIYVNGGFEGYGAKTSYSANVMAYRGLPSTRNSYAIMQSKNLSYYFSGQAVNYIDVTWDRAFSTDTYAVWATAQNSNAYRYLTSIYSITKTGCRVYIFQVESAGYTGNIYVQVFGIGDN